MSTAERLLEYLENREGDFVSGAEIAAALGVSTTAVWKAASKLREQGHQIDAATNRGYRLVRTTKLSAAAIKKYYTSLNNSNEDAESNNSDSVPASGLKVEVFETVDSTNNVCQDRAARGEQEVYVAVSSHQSAGRGRQGRSFYSPFGTGLYMSILLRPQNMPASESLSLTTIAAVAVAQAIEQVTGRTADIKWVNDIYMDGRKVCGILTEGSFNFETSALDYAIVGIGINVKTPDGGFPGEIRDTAGAICDSNEDIDRSLLTAAVLRNFMHYYRELCANSGTVEYMDEYRKRCFVIGKQVDVLKPGADATVATAIGLDNHCGLIVRNEDGSEDVLTSGEIRIRVPANGMKL